MKIRLINLFLLGAVSIAGVLRLEAAPINDDFGNRTELFGLTNRIPDSNESASREQGEPVHAGDVGGHSVWWTWVAPTNGQVTIDTVGSSFDTLLAVYTGVSISTLSVVATNDDRGFDKTSAVTFYARKGTAYQLVVDGWGGESGTIQLNLECQPAPGNDLFEDRIVLEGMINELTWNLQGATLEPGEGLSSYGGSVWWEWTPQVYGDVTVIGTDLYIEVFSGSWGDRTSAASGYVSWTFGLTFTGIPGTTYYLAAHSFSDADFQLSLAQEPAREPQITMAPRGVTAARDYLVTFMVTATGTPPLTYHWSKDGQVLPGAIEPILTLPNIQPADVGTYSVIVSNLAGTAVCPDVQLGLTLPMTVTTVAGGTTGASNGLGRLAQFNEPQGIAVDSQGIVYVADRGNHLIRKLTPAGNVSTFAGQAGSAGADDGTGTAARFSNPSGVAVDGAGNVYVADTDNMLIRRITPEGDVTTVAGAPGVSGTADGLGDAARFTFPTDIAVDPAGNLYVVDYYHYTIRKITPTGDVTTLVSEIAASGLAVDASGFVYVASSGSVKRITPTGDVSEIAGRVHAHTIFFPGIPPELNGADKVAVDGLGNIYIVDGDRTIRILSSAGALRTVVGSPWEPGGTVDGAGPAARLPGTMGLAIGSDGTIVMADGENRICRGDFRDPAIIRQPRSQGVLVGGRLELTVVAGSEQPLSFQWRRNGINIEGATAESYVILNAQVSDSGQYTVAITHPSETAISSDAVVTVATPPTNDDFERRFHLSGLTNTASGHSIGATLQAGEPNHHGRPAGHSVWWSWTAPSDGTVVIETAGSSFDTAVAIYSGESLTELRRIASDNDGGDGSASLARFSATSNSVYQIAVAGVSDASGNIVLTLRAAPPTSSVGIRFSSSWPGFRGGEAKDVEVVGTLAYVAAGHGGVLTLDVLDPRKPRYLSSFDTQGEARCLAAAGGYLYVGSGASGLQVIDVRSPAYPVLMARHASLTNVSQILVRGDRIFVADTTAGLHVFDRLSPTNVQPITVFQCQPRALALDDQYAYIADAGDGFLIASHVNGVDFVRQTNFFGLNGQFVGGARSVVKEGALVYLCGTWAMHILDVHNPVAPIWLGSHEFLVFADEIGTDIAVRGSRAYFTYRGTSYGFVELDVSNPRAPSLISHRNVGETPLAVSVSFDSVFVASGVSGIYVFDVQDPLQPPVWFPTQATAYNAAVQGNHLYAGFGYGGIQVLDIANPSSPQLVGVASEPGFALGMLGAYALIFALEGEPTLGLLDVSDPRRPFASGPRSRGQVVGIATSGSRAALLYTDVYNVDLPPAVIFANARARGIGIFDYRDRHAPELLWSGLSGLTDEDDHPADYPRFSGARDIAFAEDYAFVPGADASLFGMDLRDPQSRFRTPGHIIGHVVEAENDLLALGGAGGIELFDISNPAKPVSVSVSTVSATDLAIYRQHLVVIDRNAGLRILDVTQRTNFVQVGSYEAPGFERILLAGHHAILSHRDQGITILDLGPTFARKPEVSFQPQPRRAIPREDVRFDLGAVGSLPLSYQWIWRKPQTNGPVDVPLSGETTLALTLRNIQTNQAGDYFCMVSNSAGLSTSALARLEVDFPPTVQLTNPAPNQVFFGPASIAIAATAFDPELNGSVTNVAFYVGTELITNVARAPYQFVLPVTPSRSYLLRARATDNEGAFTDSEPVTVLVTNAPVFQLGQSEYTAYESHGSVWVTVRHSGTNAGSVSYFTTNVSAQAIADNGSWQYQGVTGRLDFAAGEASKRFEIPIVNDQVYRAGMAFKVILTNPANAVLVDPVQALISILDDDPVASTNSFTDVRDPFYTNEPLWSLQVRLNPERDGRWRFPWETIWRKSDQVASNLVRAEYSVEFQPLAGYEPLPRETIVVVTNTTLSRFYQSTGPGPGQGELSIVLLPEGIRTGINRGQWQLVGDAAEQWHDSGAVTNLAAGLHVVTFRSVEGYETPAPRVVEVIAGQQMEYERSYPVAALMAGYGPEALPNYRAITNGFRSGLPYPFSGQLLTDEGYGSGFVVKRHTVLTAAHLLFDWRNLAYVEPNRVWWFFQRHGEERVAPPAQPRGWYVFEGYAAQRATDQQAPGLSNGDSSISARSMDVAAMYFTSSLDAGRGGQGGYLVSGEAGDKWLLRPWLKMLVGYPMEAIQEGNERKMHDVRQGNYEFVQQSEQVYLGSGFYSSGGNSGGPLCVQGTNSNGQLFFFPAAVYLGGTSAGGGEVYVRAIDLDIVDLIDRAEKSSGDDNDHGSGGVILVEQSATSGTGLRRMSVAVEPLGLGAQWRILDGTHVLRDYDTAPLFTVSCADGVTNVTVQFSPVQGWDLSNDTAHVQLVCGGTTKVTARYAPAGTFAGVGYVLAHIGPELATRQGGGLTLRGPDGRITLVPEVLIAVSNVSRTGASYLLDWVPLCGWGNNGPLALTLTAGRTQQVDAVYQPWPASLEGSRKGTDLQLRLSGAVGMSYRVEWTTNLSLANGWVTNTAAHGISNCLPLLLPGLGPTGGGTRFYRATPVSQ